MNLDLRNKAYPRDYRLYQYEIESLVGKELDDIKIMQILTTTEAYINNLKKEQV